ncbi:MAG: tRNA threonylcarbamoyladenosine dehydratase [Candidatus Omnitrophota bacterium]
MTSERLVRTQQLLGERALGLLKDASVAVFGLGAVGSFAIETLVRAGLGRLTLVDFDKIKLSNFNRQLLALESTRDRLKTDVAKQRILEINPDCRLSVHSVFASPENYGEILTPAPDVVIDAIDSLNPKAGLIEYCVKNGIPVVSSMGAGEKTDPLLVRIGDLSEVKVCALAKHLKKRLRKRQIKSGVRCVYSLQKPLKSKAIWTEQDHEDHLRRRGRKREPVGTIVYMTGIFGLLCGYEAINLILNKPN